MESRQVAARAGAVGLGLYPVGALIWLLFLGVYAFSPEGSEGGFATLALTNLGMLLPFIAGFGTLCWRIWCGGRWARRGALLLCLGLVLLGVGTATEALGMHGDGIELTGLAIGLPAAAAFGLLALTEVGWIMRTRRPRGSSHRRAASFR